MKMKIAQIQLAACADADANLCAVSDAMDALDAQRPDLVALGEMFCCPYDTACFPAYAEPEGGGTWRALGGLAARHGVLLSAGTAPELGADGRVYNTAYVFGPDGAMLAKHRKMHLFDVDIRGGQRFRESDTLTAGDAVTVFDTAFGPMGLCVCFDIRFPELARLMALRGARVVLVPASFNGTSGPAHWELCFRARAVDNQCWYVGTSGALDTRAGYHAWGHSIVVSPWGDVAAQMDEKPGVQVTEIDLAAVDDVRAQLPLLSARRTDVYRIDTFS